MNEETPAPCRRFQFRLSQIEKLDSDACGVYAFWYRNRCIYVGMAQKQSVRRRLLKHWAGTHNEDLKLWIDAKRDALSVCCKIISRASLIPAEERRQIGKLQPLANKIMYAGQLWPEEED